jgi:hypothetical protein
LLLFDRIIFVLYRFEPAFEWSDCPYSIWLIKESERQPPQQQLTTESRALLQVILVNAAENKVMAFRALTLSQRVHTTAPRRHPRAARRSDPSRGLLQGNPAGLRSLAQHRRHARTPQLRSPAEDPTCYKDGKVQYTQLARTELFQKGLTRIQDGIAKGFRIALMCAEKEPLECHRSILVSKHLVLVDLDIKHIRADDKL